MIVLLFMWLLLFNVYILLWVLLKKTGLLDKADNLMRRVKYGDKED